MKLRIAQALAGGLLLPAIALPTLMPLFDWDGLPHVTLGNATWQVQAGRLLIGNIGPTGTDGFAVDLGGVQAHSLYMAGLRRANSSLHAAAFGSVQGIVQQIGSYTVSASNDCTMVCVSDFTPIGAASVSVDVYLHGALVSSQSGVQGPFASTHDVPADSVSLSLLDLRNAGPKQIMEYARPVNWVVAWQPQAVLGDRIVVKPDPPEPPDPPLPQVDWLSRVEVYGVNNGMIIDREDVGMFDFDFNALGGARLQGLAGQELEVTHIGPSGVDGIAIQIDDTGIGRRAYDVHWNPLDPIHELPTGAEIRLDTFGRIDGESGRLMGSMRAQKNSTGDWEHFVDLSSLGGALQTVDVFYEGGLVYQRNGVAWGIMASAEFPFSDFHITGYKESTLPNGEEIEIPLGYQTWNGHVPFEFPDPTLLSSATVVVGDAIRSTPENPTSMFEHFDRFLITGKNLPSLVIDLASSTPLSPTDVSTAIPSLRRLAVVPNPFNPQVEIRYDVGAPGPVSVMVLDARGRLVKLLQPTRHQAAGTHRLAWDGRDGSGASAASGVYLFRVNAGAGAHTIKGVLLR